ncbi:MAG: hypothetical protein IJQ47_09620 [Synergistaceae bacterium]|nr:hypothetical protein [Synergistaceae bacterium]
MKSAAENYLKAQDKNSADVLVKKLEDSVCSIDELIGLCESETGKQFFGAEKAAEMAKAAHDAKGKGENLLVSGMSGRPCNLRKQRNAINISPCEGNFFFALVNNKFKVKISQRFFMIFIAKEKK